MEYSDQRPKSEFHNLKYYFYLLSYFHYKKVKESDFISSERLMELKINLLNEKPPLQNVWVGDL